MSVNSSSTFYDLIIVGAGPIGLAAACAAQDEGLAYLVFDKAGLCQSISEFAPRQSFYSPATELEIGGIPFPVAGDEKPRREDTLAYYRAVARSRKLALRTWERVIAIDGGGDAEFAVRTRQQPDEAWEREYLAKYVLLSSGVWDNPRRLDVPGSDLRKVIRRYVDPTPYYGRSCLVVGGGNSAAEVAMALARSGAATTMVMIEACLEDCRLRPFVLRDLLMLIDEKLIELKATTRVACITSDSVTLESESDGAATIPNDFVFTMIGNEPDWEFLARCGLHMNSDDGKPLYDPETFESNVPRLFLAGSITREAHIVNGRLRAGRIVRHIARELRAG